MVLADQEVEVREILEAIGILQGLLVLILTDHFGIRELMDAVLLKIDHKLKRVITCSSTILMSCYAVSQALRNFDLVGYKLFLRTNGCGRIGLSADLIMAIFF